MRGSAGCSLRQQQTERSEGRTFWVAQAWITTISCWNCSTGCSDRRCSDGVFRATPYVVARHGLAQRHEPFVEDRCVSVARKDHVGPVGMLPCTFRDSKMPEPPVVQVVTIGIILIAHRRQRLTSPASSVAVAGSPASTSKWARISGG